MTAQRKLSLRELGRNDVAIRWLAVSILVLVFGFVVWFNQVHSDPNRVFWGMLANNLATPSVTKEVVNSSGLTSTDELTRLVFSSGIRVHDLKKFSDSSNGPTIRLNLESIATPSDLYQRYSLIDQPGLLGQKKPDYSKVYNLWLLNGGGTNNNRQIFSSAIFSPILFGNLSPAQRAEIMGYFKAHAVYKTDYSKASRSQSGRRSYTYTVTVNLKGLANASQLYAKALGLPAASAPNPGSYQDSSQSQISLTVDVLSHQLRELAYSNSTRKEVYNGYGIISDTLLPAHTVSLQTFQNALNAALQ